MFKCLIKKMLKGVKYLSKCIDDCVDKEFLARIIKEHRRKKEGKSFDNKDMVITEDGTVIIVNNLEKKLRE